jgi:hypothetical protein
MIETVIIGRLSGAAVLVGGESEGMEEGDLQYSKHAYYIGCKRVRPSGVMRSLNCARLRHSDDDKRNPFV